MWRKDGDKQVLGEFDSCGLGNSNSASAVENEAARCVCYHDWNIYLQYRLMELYYTSWKLQIFRKDALRLLFKPFSLTLKRFLYCLHVKCSGTLFHILLQGQLRPRQTAVYWHRAADRLLRTIVRTRTRRHAAPSFVHSSINYVVFSIYYTSGVNRMTHRSAYFLLPRNASELAVLSETSTKPTLSVAGYKFRQFFDGL